MIVFKHLALLAVVVGGVVLSSYADSEDSAVFEIRKDLEKLGLVEEFNPITEEIVGVGSVVASRTEGVEGWEEKFVEMLSVARAKAALEVSKTLSGNLSAARAVESSNRENSRYKATTRVVRMRTEGHPIGCRVVARRQKIVQGKMQVAIALKWSLQLEEEAIKIFTHPQRVEDEVLERWAEKQDLVSLVGPCFWTDEQGRACFLGIGVAELKGEGRGAVKTAMRLANIRARRYVAYCFLENLSGEEVAIRKSIRKTVGQEGVAQVESDYAYEIRKKAQGLVLPGMMQVYSSNDARSPFTGKRMCVCVYALSAASVQVRGEPSKKIAE